jgi:hypothetical protein
LNLNLNTKELAGSLMSSLSKSGNESQLEKRSVRLEPREKILLSFNGGEVIGEVMMINLWFKHPQPILLMEAQQKLKPCI